MLTFNNASSKKAVRSEKMKRRKLWIKSRSKKILALYYWGKFLGINPLSFSEKNRLQYSYSSVFYACFLTMMYCYTYYGLFMTRYTILLPEETPVAHIVDYLAITWECLVNLSTWIVFAIFQDRIKIIVKSFVTAERTSEKLGIPSDWDKQIKEFGVHLIIINILFLISFVGSHRLWTLFDTYYISPWKKLNHPGIASLNVEIIFIWCMIIVRRKFRQLNEYLEFLMENRCDERNEVHQRLIRQSSCDYHLPLDKINMLSQLHRELRNIIQDLEEHFASILFFKIGNAFTDLTVNVYRICCYLKAHPTQDFTLAYFGALSHWLLHPLASLIVTSNVCGSMSDEANDTGNVLHKGLNKLKHFHGIREAATFNALSLDLLKNQVSISVYGLFKLDHFWFYSTVAAGSTYLTIMLQLYN